MSKSSSKQKYLQLKDWLPTFKKSTPSTNQPKQESRMNYYKKKGGA
tara:strand:+ start:41 stop:178 length:138 start_codon:yes stop_codon:yes gene_type:complete